MEETKYYTCRGCGTDTPKEAVDDDKKTVFWFGARKNTRDFWMLMSNMRLKIVTIKTLDVPVKLLKEHDFYCIDCLLEDSERLRKEKVKWEKL